MATVDVYRIANKLDDVLLALGLKIPYSPQIMVDKVIE
jgi:hypothetical protein